MTERLFAQQWLDVKRLNPNAPNIDLSLTFSLKFEQELGGRPLVHGPTISDVIVDNEKLVHAVLAHVDLQPADTTVISQETEISPNLKVRIYTPPNYIENMPVGVFFHGGGWCLGDLNTEDPECRSFSLAAGVVIVSVGYRLAPLHKYPAALDDCLAAYKWAMKNSTFLKTAPDEAFLMGGSAGGNLALGVALRLIDEGHAGSLKGILAMVPVTCHPDLVPKEFKDMYKAYEENAEYSSNTTSAMMAFIDAYAAPITCKYTYPLLHPRLRDLPKTYIAAAGRDTLRDDARLMRVALNRAEVPNKFHEFEGYPHWFWTFPSRHLAGAIKEYNQKLLEVEVFSDITGIVDTGDKVAAFYPKMKGAVERQHVFVNKRVVRKRRLSVQIRGIDKKVTTNIAVGQVV